MFACIWCLRFASCGVMLFGIYFGVMLWVYSACYLGSLCLLLLLYAVCVCLGIRAAGLGFDLCGCFGWV